MTRVKRGLASHKRHKKLLKDTKGYRGKSKKLVKWAKNARMKAGQNSYRGRKLKKRQFRSTWILRINAACKAQGLNYSRMIYGLLKAKVAVDRKMLAELAVSNPEVFNKLVETAKSNI